MKILFVVDVKGWCWEHRAKAIQKRFPKGMIDIIYGKDWRKSMGSNYSHVHYFDIEGSPEFASTGLYSWHPVLDQNFINFGKFHSLVCVNKGLYDWAQKKKINDRIHYIRNGIDTELFFPKPELRSEKKFVVGFSAKKTPPHADVKGYHSIWLPLVERLKKYPHIEVLEHSNHYYDGLPHEGMCDLFNRMNLLVCPSAHEGSLGSLLEAMACEVPVISTLTGVVPELTSNGVLKVPSYVLGDTVAIPRIVDEIERKVLLLSKNPDLCSLYGILNRSEIETDFAWDKIIPIWNDFFMRVGDKSAKDASLNIASKVEYVNPPMEKNADLRYIHRKNRH